METPPARYGESVRIYNHYTDKHHRLKLKTLCDLFNDMAELHTLEQHVNVAALNTMGLTWMLRRIHIGIVDMPKWEEKVWIETWNPSFDGLLVPRAYKVEDSRADIRKLGRLRAFAYTEWMIIRLENRRPERPAPYMSHLAGHYAEELPFTGKLLDKDEAKGRFDPGLYPNRFSRDFQACYSDIDFNGHVTQSSYVQWMLNAHPEAFLESRSIREMEVVYLHEIRPEAKVRVELQSTGFDAAEERVEVVYQVFGEGGKTLHAYAKAVWE